MEIVAVKLKQANKDRKDIVIVSYYNPPNLAVDNEVLKVLLNTPSTIIVGDLNCHSKLWLSQSSNKSGRLIEALMLNGTAVLINDDSPTYEPLHRPDYKAIIDLVLCTEDLTSSISNYEVTDEFRTDHLSIIFSLKSCLPTESDRRKIQIKSTDWSLFYQRANELHPKLESLLNTSLKIDEATSALTETIKKALEEATKTKTLELKTNAA